MRETITVYWAPIVPTNRFSINFAFIPPYSLTSSLHHNRIPGSVLPTCPAHKNSLKNVFVLEAGVTDHIKLADNVWDVVDHRQHGSEIIAEKSVFQLTKTRGTSFEGYANVLYDLQWIFFASEPVTMKLTAPYYPATTPVPGALFTLGEMDIGRWFRNINLDYHIPLSAREFNVTEGDHLAYLEFMTDKKIEFKRFNMTEELFSIATEVGDVSNRYGKNKTLQYRYDASERIGLRDIVMHHILKNVIEPYGSDSTPKKSKHAIEETVQTSVLDISGFDDQSYEEAVYKAIMDDQGCPYPHDSV